MCSLQKCRREVQAAQYLYFMLSRDCDSIDPPSTPALRSCPGSCRCVGSPALKNVKSDEQCTAAAPLSPTNHFGSAREHDSARRREWRKGHQLMCNSCVPVRTAKQSSRAHYILAGFPIPFSVLPPWATPVPEPTATSLTGAPVPTERLTEG